MLTSFSSTFASDNFSGVHPEVMEAIQKANVGHCMAYGGDPWTEKAEQIFKNVFGPSAEAYFVFNGTAANVCAVKQSLQSWQAVLCSESAHIWTDECGAPSAISGCSLLTIPTNNGKLQLDALEMYMHYTGNQHHVQPAAISITQSTELGTVYTLNELKEIASFAKQHHLLLMMDGARLSNAAVALNLSLKQLTTDIGVDILSYGGTKNGLMGVDAVVFLKKGLSEHFP